MLDNNENKRVNELISYETIELAPEPELDEITKLASLICETPISVITLVDDTTMWIKSKQGTPLDQLPKKLSMCQYTIQQQDLFIVPDLQLDDRYVLDPIELGGPGYRFYAGVPLVTPSGYNIGTLCVLDYKPRNLNENQIYLMKSMAKQVITNFELKKNNKELIKLNEKIRFYKGKEEFFSNMSHELRTPLNAISGFTDLLSKTQLDKQQNEYVGILRSSIDYLSSIVNDVLDYSKIDSGNLKIESHTFNIRTLIKTAYELFKIKTKEKNISFSVDILKNVPSYINGDKTRLNQILVNLLGNAIKFTKEGSVSMKIKMLKDTEKEIALSFSVKDTGIGIAPEKLNDIFERFHQVEGTTRVFGGSGLGLSIVKSLVELQNGKITVKSELGKYSEFFINIPFQKSSQEEISNLIKEEESSECLPTPDLDGIRILLAEDNIINIKLI